MISGTSGWHESGSLIYGILNFIDIPDLQCRYSKGKSPMDKLEPETISKGFKADRSDELKDDVRGVSFSPGLDQNQPGAIRF